MDGEVHFRRRESGVLKQRAAQIVRLFYLRTLLFTLEIRFQIGVHYLMRRAMNRLRQLWILPFTFTALLSPSGFAQTNVVDRLAEIASSTGSDSAQLVTPQPPKLPNKVIAFGKHDPNAVFQPGEKMTTPEQLTRALVEARSASARFLEN